MTLFSANIQQVLCQKKNAINFSNLLIVVLLLISSVSFAQSNQTELDIFQDAFGLEKKVAVANFMKLSDADKNFWTIYDNYEAERKELGKARIQIIVEYANSYPDISEEKILELYNRTNSLKKSFAKLQSTYFNKMKKEVGISKAAQFWQLEGYFNSIIQAEIYSQIPFIGENLDQK